MALALVMQPVWGGCVAEVIMSANPEFKTGDTVLGRMKFAEYDIVPKGQGLQKVDGSQAPPSYYLGVLGKFSLDIVYILLYVQNVAPWRYSYPQFKYIPCRMEH